VKREKMFNFIKQQIVDSYQTKEKLLKDENIFGEILKISEKAVEIYRDGKKTLIAGNGGSAADAQHIAGEFVSRFYFDRPALPSIALTTDTSILTAVGNDYGYEKIFSRQIEANGVEGDMFIAISTSGNSENILQALSVAKERGLITVGLTGESGGKMAEICDFIVKVPSKETPRVQESHILVGHIICAVVEEELFGEKGN
jgi:D-sedoheptulose 7-phosphate isomerase